MDYMDKKKIKFYKSSSEFFNSKKKERIILLPPNANKSFFDFKFNKNDTLLFGRESSGVPKNVHEIANERLRIPMIKNKPILVQLLERVGEVQIVSEDDGIYRVEIKTINNKTEFKNESF